MTDFCRQKKISYFSVCIIESRDIKKNAFFGLNFLSELCLAILKTNPEEKNNFSGVFHVESTFCEGNIFDLVYSYEWSRQPAATRHSLYICCIIFISLFKIRSDRI